jgi:plastocyanin
MNTKLLASIAVFALLAGVVSTSIMQSVYAADYGMNDKTADKKTAMDQKVADKKTTMNQKMADKKTAMDQKVADKKTTMNQKMADKKTAMDQKMADKKTAMDQKMADKKTAMDQKMADKTMAASDTVAVEMAKGSGSNTSCADKCYIPNAVRVKVGGTVTWKNADSAAHYATSGKDATSDGIFDSGMVNAGKTFSHKFDKAGTFDYFCMVHPWMMGKVTVS